VIRNATGWTLIELLIALAIVAILGGFAVSSVSALIQAGRSSAAHTDLLATLTTARSAAAVRETDVRVCPSADGRTCADSYHWEQGWIVYVDANNNNSKDDTDVVIGSYPKAGDGVRVITSTGRRTIEFQSSGGNGGSNATFTICDRRGPAKAQAFAMSNTGGLRAVAPSATAVTEACYP
jgi:type IV fimbrial biogenesis protein FimT